MKKILKIFVSLVTFALLWVIVYSFQPEFFAQFFPFLQNFKNQMESVLFTPAPCAEPIPYVLGTFDPQFGISKKYFLSALSDAEAIWEKPEGSYLGKNLFDYTPTNSTANVLKVNLIYDYRQQATSKLSSLGIVVQENRTSYDMLKAKFTALKTELEKAKNDYNARVESFNTKQKAYEQEVNYWNGKGGAPQQEYDKLQAEKAALNIDVQGLQKAQDNINSMVDEINALVVVLNRLVNTLNISVDRYNTVGASRGESFEEGVYSSNGLNREIDIYEFSSRAKLVRVLAHELGHALDLGHLDDPKAIMYKLNQGNNQTLTKADLDALKTRCGIK